MGAATNARTRRPWLRICVIVMAATRADAQSVGEGEPLQIAASATSATSPIVAPAALALDPLERLPGDMLGSASPATRVAGGPGAMRIADPACRSPGSAELRRRIVDVAIQEWAFFRFPILDQTQESNVAPRPPGSWRRPQLDPDESARVASSIAGYWAATPDGDWILERQNAVWNGPGGIAERWRDPWSAAFISWVMCEAGLADSGQFRRAIAHHRYIDQAIEARDGSAASAFVAYDVGEREIEPGDLLCAARRPPYRTLDERRAQLGVGIRSHCDIVVKVDRQHDRIFVIGGNVRGAVRLKLHAADFSGEGGKARRVGLGRRTVFVHLKLDADSIGPDGFVSSPTVRVLARHGNAVETLRERLGDPLLFQVPEDGRPAAATMD